MNNSLPASKTAIKLKGLSEVKTRKISFTTRFNRYLSKTITPCFFLAIKRPSVPANNLILSKPINLSSTK